jgi:hypothetical protein
MPFCCHSVSQQLPVAANKALALRSLVCILQLHLHAAPTLLLAVLTGEDASCQMHLGAYGQAYFAAETMEIVSGEHTATCTSNTCQQQRQLHQQHNSRRSDVLVTCHVHCRSSLPTAAASLRQAPTAVSVACSAMPAVL